MFGNLIPALSALAKRLEVSTSVLRRGAADALGTDAEIEHHGDGTQGNSSKRAQVRIPPLLRQ